MKDGGSIDDFLVAAEQLLDPVDAFFENVFVMTDDLAVRQNRLALLRYAPVLECCSSPSERTQAVTKCYGHHAKPISNPLTRIQAHPVHSLMRYEAAKDKIWRSDFNRISSLHYPRTHTMQMLEDPTSLAEPQI